MIIVLKKTLKITKTMTIIRMITMMTMMMLQDIWSEHSRRTQEDPESLMREEIPSPNPSVLSLEDWVIPTHTYHCHSRHMLRSANMGESEETHTFVKKSPCTRMMISFLILPPYLTARPLNSPCPSCSGS